MNLIIDGHNTFIRNFVVNPTSDPNGNPIGGLLGTLRSVKWAIQEFKVTKVIFVWDGPGGAQRRRSIIGQYKSGRKPRLNREVEEGTKDSRENMDWQREKVEMLLPFLGVIQVKIDNIEADDTIGYLVGLLDPQPKVILSSDRDMWQLVSDTTVVYWPTKKCVISTGTFKEHSLFAPANFILARALSGHGDASDNIQGIKGLGDKTIIKLFPELGERPVDESELYRLCEERLGDGKGPKRWYQAILDQRSLVNTNVSVMQLTTPNISAQAGFIIRQAAEKKPAFNITGFKIALLNNGLQVTDRDIFTAFQEYKQRASYAAA